MTKTNETKRPPSHAIYTVIGDDDTARWVRVGAAWPNRDGKGLNLIFDAYPVVGRIVLREIDYEAKGEGRAR